MPRFDVTIAGELNLDLILYGLPEVLQPERELLADRMMVTLGGSSAIVAHNLAALGRKVGFQSRIGVDALGQIALQRMQEGGVDVSKVRQNDARQNKEALQTGLSVIIQHDAWRNILTYSGTISELTLLDLDFEYLADSRHFHMSSYFLQTKLQPHVSEIFKRMKAAGLTISMDTNDDPDDTWQSGFRNVLPFLDVFMPNEREIRKAAGTDDLEEAIRKMADIVPLVVVKMGKEGALAQRGAERFTSPALKVDFVDAVGAGDSFDAGFLSQYVRGADIPTCMASGNKAGALSTTKPGGTEAFRDVAHREKFLRQ